MQAWKNSGRGEDRTKAPGSDKKKGSHGDFVCQSHFTGSQYQGRAARIWRLERVGQSVAACVVCVAYVCVLSAWCELLVCRFAWVNAHASDKKGSGERLIGQGGPFSLAEHQLNVFSLQSFCYAVQMKPSEDLGSFPFLSLFSSSFTKHISVTLFNMMLPLGRFYERFRPPSSSTTTTNHMSARARGLRAR